MTTGERQDLSPVSLRFRLAEQTIKAVLEKHTDELLALPGVVAVGEGAWRGKPCVFVFVSEDEPDVLGRVPGSLDGYRVRIEVSGEFRASGRRPGV